MKNFKIQKIEKKSKNFLPSIMFFISESFFAFFEIGGGFIGLTSSIPFLEKKRIRERKRERKNETVT